MEIMLIHFLTKYYCNIRKILFIRVWIVISNFWKPIQDKIVELEGLETPTPCTSSKFSPIDKDLNIGFTK
jgi:hypothetical protein